MIHFALVLVALFVFWKAASRAFRFIAESFDGGGAGCGCLSIAAVVVLILMAALVVSC